MYIGRRLGRIIELKCKIQTTPSNIGLCLPHPLDGLCDTNIVCLELVQTDGGGNSESTQQPVQERLGLGDAALGEVVDDRGTVTCQFRLPVKRRTARHTGNQCGSGGPAGHRGRNP